MNFGLVLDDKRVRGAGAGLLIVVVALSFGTFVFGGPRGMAAMLQGHFIYVSPPKPRQAVLRAAEPLRATFRVTNVSFGEVLIKDRSTRCGHAFVEGLPARLGVFQSKRFTLVGDARDIGTRHFFGRVSAHRRTRSQSVSLSITGVVHADQVERNVFAGRWRGGGAWVSRTVRLENLPAGQVDRIERISIPGWSVRVADARDRNLDIEISGSTPEETTGDFTLRFRVLFNSPEVRCANVRIGAILEPQWSFPVGISIDPLSSGQGNTVAMFVHRPRCESDDRSWIEVVDSSVEWLEVFLKGTEDHVPGPSAKMWRERRFHVAVRSSERHVESAGTFKIRLVGDDGYQFVEIPVVVTGSPATG